MASKAIEFGEKRKIRTITPLKVIQGTYVCANFGENRSKNATVCSQTD